jgi:hypothetical protein
MAQNNHVNIPRWQLNGGSKGVDTEGCDFYAYERVAQDSSRMA